MQLLTCHMPYASAFFSLLGTTLASVLSQEFKAETFYYHASTFADSTKATYKSHKDSYLRFCIFMGYNPIPVSTFVTSQYASFLARSFKFSSVKGYLGVISLLHKEFSLPNPLSDNWAVKSVLTGIKRVKGDSIKQKLLSTIDILSRVHNDILSRVCKSLNLKNSYDTSFWVICLLAFFLFLSQISFVASV